jgi:uncharacterized protein YndB with AHSA1/START domain
VLAYEPPNRVVLSWDIDPRWQIDTDPNKTSEAEVRLTPKTPGRTRVERERVARIGYQDRSRVPNRSANNRK